MTRREFTVRGLMAAGGSALAGCTAGWFKEAGGCRQYQNVGLYALDQDRAMMEMLNEWIAHMRRKCGMVRHPFSVGALNQIAMLRSPAAYPSFSVRNLFANARYWDGGSRTVDYAKRYFAMHPDAGGKIPENTLSLGMRFEYGPFKAYFGGDIDDPDHEALLGPVAGPVDVCKTNHHACPSSMGAAFCRCVRAQMEAYRNALSHLAADIPLDRIRTVLLLEATGMAVEVSD